MRWRSTWRCCRSIRSGTARTATRRPQIVKVQNEKLAELCAARPERFAAFASLTLQFPDLAVQQLETAIKKQGLRGAAIGGSVLGEDFSDPEIPSGLGQGRRTRRGAVHPSAEHAGTCQALQGQRLAVEHDRQSARHHDRPAAPDLRGNARSLSRASRSLPRMAAAISAPMPRAAIMPASCHRRTAIRTSR